MGFQLDPHSLKNLGGVHPDLVRVVEDCAANGVMPFTFGINEGLRTLQQQKLDVAAGRSQTQNSRHLDGHAVDLVVLINQKISWAWPPYYQLAEQMKASAVRCSVPLEWGAAWGINLLTYGGTASKASGDYVTGWHAAHPDGHGHPFMDGPHFQLPRAEYPSGAHTPGIRT